MNSKRSGIRPIHGGQSVPIKLNQHGLQFGLGQTWAAQQTAALAVPADLTGVFEWTTVPVLWLEGLERIQSIPLYGSGTREEWLSPPVGAALTEMLWP